MRAWQTIVIFVHGVDRPDQFRKDIIPHNLRPDGGSREDDVHDKTDHNPGYSGKEQLIVGGCVPEGEPNQDADEIEVIPDIRDGKPLDERDDMIEGGVQVVGILVQAVHQEIHILDDHRYNCQEAEFQLIRPLRVAGIHKMHRLLLRSR